MNLRALWLACTALTVVAGPTASQAQVWDGSSSTNWFDATNWSTNAVPTAADNVIVNTIAPNPTVISSAAAVSSVGQIANVGGSTGQVTVTGANASWTTSDFLFVGSFGTGTLVIQNGGAVTNTTGTLGLNAGSIGHATVEGTSSRWTNSGSLDVGLSGTGTLLIRDGGRVTNTIGRIGGNIGSNGNITVSGDGSSWTNSGSLFVGDTGTGTLVIQDGGQVTNTIGSIGGTAGSTGQATVTGTGSSWTNSDNLRVGNAGTGTLVIQNGGQVTSTFGTIGVVVGSSGHVTVSGAGASWISGSVEVGSRSSGTLVIQNAGQVTGVAGLIGNVAGSTGQVTVSGAGSRWTNSNSLDVGNDGVGTLVIQNGGLVINPTGSIGNGTGATGQVTVDGTAASWIATLLRIGNRGTGTLTIQSGGTVNATSVSIANNTGAVGTLNIGAASGAVAVAPGTLSTPTVTFGNGAGQIVFNHTATSYTFAPLISGAGTVRVENGTTNLAANNTYTGNTLVNGGTLLVNGSIASSPTTVNAGGTLGGAGTVGSTDISGGTLSPGNAIGTLSVQGNLTFTAASTYLIEVDPAGSDRTNVTGSATLGGATVSAVYASGSYVMKRYTILNATGGVVGTFNSLVNTNLPANFTPSLNHDANNAYLDLTLNFTPTPPTPTPPGFTPTPPAPSFVNGLSGNQTNVANAVINSFNTAGGIPLVFGALTPQGLTQVSGEAATGMQQTTFDAMGQFTSMLLDPSLGERGGASAHAEGANSYASIGTAKTLPPATLVAQRWNVWAAGYGVTQSTDGNAAVGSNDLTSRIYGAAAGFDYRLSPQTLVGFSLGGAGTKYDLANGLGGGRSEMFQAGVYGRHDIGATYVAGVLAYGWQDVTTDRNVLLSSLRARFDTNAISGRLEAGHRFATGLVGLTPYAAGQFTTVFLPDYAEQVVAGASTFALSYAGKDVTALRSELGLRADRSFAMQDAIVTLRGRAAWAHNFNTERSVATFFQTLPVASFVVNGAAPAADAALVTASAETRWRNGVSVAASFDGEFSNVTESTPARASFGIGGEVSASVTLARRCLV